MKKTIIAATAVAVLFGTFICLPAVRGQNGPAAARAPKSSAKPAPATASGTAAPLNIACIDFGMILREYKKVVDKRQELAAISEACNAKLKQLQGEFQAIAKPLQEGTIDQDSDEFTARQKKLFQLDNSAKTCKAAADRDQKLQSVKISVAVYEDLQAALKLFSEQNGYSLVLQIDREAAQTKDYRLYQKTLSQPVFYYRSHEDITVAVLSYLNERYEAQRAAASGDDNPTPLVPVVEPTRSIPASPNRKPAAR